MSDLRGAIFVCPGCSGPMREVLVDDTRVDFCDSCRGVWFDWFAGETSALADRVPAVEGAGPSARAGGACPRDGAALVAQPYLDAGPTVDRCPVCLGLFAARDQVARLADFHHRMPDEASEPLTRESILSRLWHAFSG